jgi:hypothetical protein
VSDLGRGARARLDALNEYTKKERTPEQRAAHAAAQQKTRAAKRERGECRQCPKPAARAIDGRVMSMCDEHLDADQKRTRGNRPIKGTRTPRKAIR